MTPAQVRKHYGTPTKFAEQTGYTRLVIYQWEQKKFVPKRAQIIVAQQSFGALKVGPPYGVKQK